MSFVSGHEKRSHEEPDSFSFSATQVCGEVLNLKSLSKKFILDSSSNPKNLDPTFVILAKYRVSELGLYENERLLGRQKCTFKS